MEYVYVYILRIPHIYTETALFCKITKLHRWRNSFKIEIQALVCIVILGKTPENSSNIKDIIYNRHRDVVVWFSGCLLLKFIVREDT